MMDQETFGQYLTQANALSIKQEASNEDPTELSQHIQWHRRGASEDSLYEPFFAGELAFYSKQYEKALKYYLQSSSLPQIPFFCYRASSYLFESLGNSEKALSFAQKANNIMPDDFMVLALLEKLYKQKGSAEALFEVQTKLKVVVESLTPVLEAVKTFHESSALILEEHILNNPVTHMELTMNTESEIFSSPKSQDQSAAQGLRQRLYPGNPEMEGNDPFAGKVHKPSQNAFEELRKLAASGREPDMETGTKFFTTELGDDATAGQLLEQRIKDFQTAQTELTRIYLEQTKARRSSPDFSLYYLNGWHYTRAAPTPYTSSLLLTEQSRRATGGIFIRWNGKGIAINPGERFLENFHMQGLHIRDIDYVVVTSEKPESYADVKEIYDLTFQLNKMSQDLQVIQYYFNHKAFQDLSRFLKPHFKQERNSLHSLEMFVDSPDVEKVELSEGIILHYFQTSARDPFSSGSESKEELASRNQSSLGIRLELKSTGLSPVEKAQVRIGYISNAPWNPLLAHHLGTCDILVTGFGNTSSGDFNKLSYNSESLGYYGTYTLLEEVAPRLLLTGEYGGREGDIRLEASMKMRREFLAQTVRLSKQTPVVLPADTGLIVDLKSLRVKCSVSNDWVEPSQTKAVKTAHAFGRLEYLAPSCCF